jgi:hypothetical protein
MLHGHDWSSSERTSHTPSERRRMLRMPRIVWFVVLLLWLSLCGLSLSYVVRYIRNQFPPPTPTPIVSIATTPTPAPSPIPSPSPSPTPSPTSTPVTPTVVSGRTDHYIGLILKNDAASHRLAYSMLSVEQLRQVSFGKFKQDMNYTLRPGCWSIVQVSSPTLERGGVTWETGVVLE